MNFNTYKSGNPTLNPKNFRTVVRPGEEVMTQNGAFIKTGILLAICVSTASLTYGPNGFGFMIPALISGFILSLITIFKKNWSPITAPLYAAVEGLLLGAISFAFQMQYQGIVFNAVMLTFSVMAIMLFLFSAEIIVVTEKLRSIVIVGTGAVCAVYLVSFVMSFFGTQIPMIHSSGPVGIGFSLVVVALAAFNLLLDFDFIEKAAATRTQPKYMEWYGAFALMVTLVWLYLEILRLLSKLNKR